MRWCGSCPTWSATSAAFSPNRLATEQPGLEGPQYTRPEEFRGWRVPEILLSGHHENVADWNHDQGPCPHPGRAPRPFNPSKTSMKLIEKIEGEQVKKQVPFHVGDSVKVHTRACARAKRSGRRSSPAWSSATKAVG